MARRLFQRDLDGGTSLELVDDDTTPTDVFRLRLDRPGTVAVSVLVTDAMLQELADAAWHAHELNGGTNDERYAGSDPD